jgi:hypothetical protein
MKKVSRFAVQAKAFASNSTEQASASVKKVKDYFDEDDDDMDGACGPAGTATQPQTNPDDYDPLDDFMFVTVLMFGIHFVLSDKVLFCVLLHCNTACNLGQTLKSKSSSKKWHLVLQQLFQRLSADGMKVPERVTTMITKRRGGQSA